jgi:hypothetical protein
MSLAVKITTLQTFLAQEKDKERVDFDAWFDDKNAFCLSLNEAITTLLHPIASCSKRQRKRIASLSLYIDAFSMADRATFDGWFPGAQTVCINIGASLLLIRDDN